MKPEAVQTASAINRTPVIIHPRRKQDKLFLAAVLWFIAAPYLCFEKNTLL
jgi:hypothetical protein